MENNVKFSKNVILVDVSFLDETVSDIKSFLGERLGRTLPDVDLPAWLSYLALDAGLREGDNEIQVLLVHGGEVSALPHCRPADLKELDGVACRTPLGEFAFSRVSSAGMAASSDLFIDLMHLALDSADVECLALVPFHRLYAGKVEEELRKCLGKQEKQKEAGRVVYFMMAAPQVPIPCVTDSVLYSLSHALGIKPEELE